jgi:predicted permease
MSMNAGENDGKQSVNLALTVLEISAPVFLLAAVGFIWVKFGFEYRMQFVTRLSMTLAVPCLVFVSLMQTEIEAGSLATLSLAALAAYAGVGVVVAVLVWLRGLDARTFINPLVFGNTGNLGLPLALFAFGETGLGYAVVVFAIMGVLSFTVGVWLVSGGGNPLKVLREPLVGATLLGALFLWQGWHTPTFLTNTLDLIGQMAIPMMLITLGVAVARLRPSHLIRSVGLSLVKLVICTAVPVAVGLWFGLEGIALAVLIVQVATPVAVTSYLLAEKYGADSDAVAGLVVASTVLSVLYLPLILAFVIV